MVQPDRGTAGASRERKSPVVSVRARSALRASRDWVLTVAAFATILAGTFGIGPFEAPGGPGGRNVEAASRLAALR